MEERPQATGALPGPCRALTGQEIVRIINGQLFYLSGTVLGAARSAQQSLPTEAELTEILLRALIVVESGYSAVLPVSDDLERVARLVNARLYLAMVMAPIEAMLKSNAQMFPAASVGAALDWWIGSENGRARLRLIAEYTTKEFETHAPLLDRMLKDTKDTPAPGEEHGQ